MQMNRNSLDQGLIENLRLSADIARVLVLVGERQHDRFVTLSANGNPIPSTLEGMAWLALEPLDALWTHDPATRTPQLFRLRPGITLSGALPLVVGRSDAQIETRAMLAGFAQMEAGPSAPPRMALLVDGGLLWEDPVHPRDADHALLRDLEHFARSGATEHRWVIIRVQSTGALPATLLASPAVRTVSLPVTHRDERMVYARLRSPGLAKAMGHDGEMLARQIAGITDGWRLDDVDALVRSSEQQNISTATELEANARAYRLGVVRSPWAGAELHAAIANAEATLAHRVRGQPAALEAVCKALRKSSTGVSGSHQGAASRGPRATLFFAGPTGTGKTETAKAIAELVFGDENAMIRFDCAEFRQEHTVARLIGAPPGYIGHEAGGELTDRIRARPHSVVLFDEIEKAHGRLLDLFLSILDDGRLTNSQGVTSNFSECVLIFTSNLGIYKDTTDESGHRIRRPRFSFDDAYEDIASAVRAAIREEFITELGRPELLGRLGGERALIVFDFLRDVRGVTLKFVENIRAAMARLHGMDLRVPDAVIDLIADDAATRPEALVLGARGLAQSLESCFQDELANFVFGKELRGAVVEAGVDGAGVVAFRATLP